MGRKTVYQWDAARKLITSHTLAQGMPEARTTTTEWHPSFRKPIKITDSTRVTEYGYDAAGNRISEKITDNSTAGAGRTYSRKWTYNAKGLLDTETLPNGAVTQYNYFLYSSNLESITDALGRKHEHFIRGGLNTDQESPNGLQKTFAYDEQNRILSMNVGDFDTIFSYNPIGKLGTIVNANGYQMSYTYDAAHRVSGWSDNRGAQASYTLDKMGNLVGEVVKNAQGTVVYEATRAVNEINRLASEKIGPKKLKTLGYDANGDLTSSKNGLDQATTYLLDGQRRISKTTDSLNGSALYEYDSLGALGAATDFKGVRTLFSRNVLGNAEQEASGDIGTVRTSYDLLGLPSKIVDALDRSTTISRDLLGRPLQVAYSDGTASVLRYDLLGADYADAASPNASIGYLSQIEDPGVTTKYQRDVFGRVIKKQQIVTGGAVKTARYAYKPRNPDGASGNGAGQIASITYPSGGVLGYTYDATGQLTGLTWNATPLVSNLTWNPLGQPTGWQWSFVNVSGGYNAARSYDTAGQLVQTELGSYTWDAAGRLSGLTQSIMVPNAVGNGVVPLALSTAYTYDALGRMTAVAHVPTAKPTLPSGVGLSAITGPDQVGMAYDANGNRQSIVNQQTEAGGGVTTQQRVYAQGIGNNRLLGYTQTQRVAGGANSTTQTAYSYDATGAVTQAGANGYGYAANGRLQTVKHGTVGNAAATYVYNALGQRVLKKNTLSSPAMTTQTVYADGPYDESTVLGTYGTPATGKATQTEVVYLPTASGPMPIAASIDGRLYAIHSDHLNTPRRLTQADGKVAWQWVTTAFGEVPPSTGATGFVQETSSAPKAAATTPPVRFDLRFPGQVADEESGLFYNFRRSYDPMTGRYLQNDPVGMVGGGIGTFMWGVIR